MMRTWIYKFYIILNFLLHICDCTPFFALHFNFRRYAHMPLKIDDVILDILCWFKILCRSLIYWLRRHEQIYDKVAELTTKQLFFWVCRETARVLCG